MTHGTQSYFAERARNGRRLSLIAGTLGFVLLAVLRGGARVPAVQQMVNDPKRFGFEGPDQFVRRITLQSLPGQAQTPPPPTPSPAFERAFLGEMDAATRAEVEKRATGGNTISGVIATMLLNSSQMATHSKADTPITVVAIDLILGVVVIQNGPNQYEPVRFDPKTLRILN